MANSPQARKRVRQATKRREHNASQRSMARTYVKKVQKAISRGDKEAAQTAFREAEPIIDRIADKDRWHKNKAARHKSRLSRQIKEMG